MKDIIWLGSSYRALRAFPKSAKQQAGYGLDRIQRGLEAPDWKPMSSVGKGVKELRIHTATEYRIVYVASYREAVYVLHAFEKKSQKTAKQDLALIRMRYQELLAWRMRENCDVNT